MNKQRKTRQMILEDYSNAPDLATIPGLTAKLKQAINKVGKEIQQEHPNQHLNKSGQWINNDQTTQTKAKNKR